MPDIPKKKIVAHTVAVFEAMAATEAATVAKLTPASIGKTKVSAAVADLMARATADINTKTTIRPNQTLRPPEIKKNTLVEALVALEATAAKTTAIVNTTTEAEAVKQKTVASAMAVLETAETAVVTGATMLVRTTIETVHVRGTSVEARSAMEAEMVVAAMEESVAAGSALAAAGTALEACTTPKVEELGETSGTPVSVTTTASAEPGMVSTVVTNIKTKTAALATAQTTKVAVKEIKDKTVTKAVVALKTAVVKTSATFLYYLYIYHWSHLFLQNLPQYLP